MEARRDGGEGRERHALHRVPGDGPGASEVAPGAARARDGGSDPRPPRPPRSRRGEPPGLRPGGGAAVHAPAAAAGRRRPRPGPRPAPHHHGRALGRAARRRPPGAVRGGPRRAPAVLRASRRDDLRRPRALPRPGRPGLVAGAAGREAAGAGPAHGPAARPSGGGARRGGGPDRGPDGDGPAAGVERAPRGDPVRHAVHGLAVGAAAAVGAGRVPARHDVRAAAAGDGGRGGLPRGAAAAVAVRHRCHAPAGRRTGDGPGAVRGGRAQRGGPGRAAGLRPPGSGESAPADDRFGRSGPHGAGRNRTAGAACRGGFGRGRRRLPWSWR
ncbi:hypothetical protein SCALM49S_03771 [Streptomyces californicus]